MICRVFVRPGLYNGQAINSGTRVRDLVMVLGVRVKYEGTARAVHVGCEYFTSRGVTLAGAKPAN